jgi:hypothetical protein
MPPYIRYRCGADPELFLAKTEGGIVSSEHFIPADEKNETGVTQDGVQIEFHPPPSGCRAHVGNAIARSFCLLKREVLDKNGLTLDFRQAITLSKKEMKNIGEKGKLLLCEPSHNNYTKDTGLTVDGATYPGRSLSGHLHFGGPHCWAWQSTRVVTDIPAMATRPRTTIQTMDLLLGNTCVIIDTSPLNIERRKLYGRAGEYRLPKHGLEYRVLSNFWLRSYQAMSLVMGLGRWILNICDPEHTEYRVLRNLLARVKKKDLLYAINQNDPDVARENFEKVIEPALEILPGLDNDNEHFPIQPKTLEKFRIFLDRGFDYWFDFDPIQHWITLPEGHNLGWETFLDQVVTKDAPRQTEGFTGFKSPLDGDYYLRKSLDGYGAYGEEDYEDEGYDEDDDYYD